MTRSKQLLQYMEQHRQEFLDILEGAVRRESPTEGDPGDLAACRDYFAALFRGIGFHVTQVKSLDSRFGDHLLMEYGKDAGQAARGLSARLARQTGPAQPVRWERHSEQLLFGGHYDTVHDKGIFGAELWKNDGIRAVGPGILDMKGGDVMVYLIVKALQDLALMPEGRRIVFFLSSDEEAGSYGSSRLYQALASQSRAAFIMESSVGVDCEPIRGLKCGRFGRGNYTFTAQGGIEKPPFDKDLPGNRALQRLALAVGEELGVSMHPGVVRGGSDGNFTAATGCPTLDGMGVTGGHVHQLGEFIYLDHLPFRLAFAAEMTLRVLEQA